MLKFTFNNKIVAYMPLLKNVTLNQIKAGRLLAADLSGVDVCQVTIKRLANRKVEKEVWP